jgi:hypothetical protein
MFTEWIPEMRRCSPHTDDSRCLARGFQCYVPVGIFVDKSTLFHENRQGNYGFFGRFVHRSFRNLLSYPAKSTGKEKTAPRPNTPAHHRCKTIIKNRRDVGRLERYSRPYRRINRDTINDIYSTLMTCGCLIQIDEEESTVRFVHPSVMDYFL